MISICLIFNFVKIPSLFPPGFDVAKTGDARIGFVGKCSEICGAFHMVDQTDSMKDIWALNKVNDQ